MSFRAAVLAIAVGYLSLSGSAIQAAQAHHGCFPKNDLDREDRLEADNANLTEADFNAITDAVVSKFAPTVKFHGGALKAEKAWTDSTVNAYADQTGADWVVHMFGGLARRPEVTKDGFAMVVCHELGHHLGGYAFYGPQDWAASEGQADYFASQACARVLWGSQTPVENANVAYAAAVSPAAVDKCDKAWPADADRALCYRTAAASQSVTTLLATLGGSPEPDAAKPDTKVVDALFVDHPEAQCRLDTYLAGASCTTNFDFRLIPGKKFADHNSKPAEAEALTTSCAAGPGSRPLCWYHKAASK